MRRTLSIIALLIAGAAPAARAAETFTIGVENTEYLPYYSYRDGEYRGLAADILNAFARDNGYVLEYRSFPIIRLFNEFAAGNVDFKFPDNALWSAEARKPHAIAYSAPVLAYVDGVSLQPARKGKGADSIKTLGTLRGFTAWDWQDRLNGGQTALSENNSFNGLIEQALLGRVDGVYANIAVVQNQLKLSGKVGALVYDPDLPHTTSDYKLSSIKHPEVLKKFDAWMSGNAAKLAKLKTDAGVDAGAN